MVFCDIIIISAIYHKSMAVSYTFNKTRVFHVEGIYFRRVSILREYLFQEGIYSGRVSILEGIYFRRVSILGGYLF